MELRHLRYFVAVAEEGSLTVAAEKRLHTAQPSLSRQMRDLEDQVGVKLMSRGVRGVELTAAGRAFLDHARLALTQAEAAVEAARRAAEPLKPAFALGFLTGTEIDWLPKAMRILHDQLPNMKLTIASQYSPDLAAELMRGRLDAAFMRPEPHAEDLVYRRVLTEPLILVFPSDHRLAAQETIDLWEIVGETFIIPSNTAPTLRSLIKGYLERSGLDDQARPRSGSSRPCGVDGRLDRRSDALARLCEEFPPLVGDQPPTARECADNRPCGWLQQGEQVPDPQAFPV